MSEEAVYQTFTLRDLERVTRELFCGPTIEPEKYKVQMDMYNSLANPLKKRAIRRSRRHKRRIPKKPQIISIPRPQLNREGMNKKLRLLVTTKCHNKCPMCCNNQFDFDTLPVVDRWDYDEIMITGGEPLSSTKKVRYLINLITSIKLIQQAQGFPIAKFYVYTATHHGHLIEKILKHIDGIVYTPHNIAELNVLNVISYHLDGYPYLRDMSMRLNIFPEIGEIIEKGFSEVQQRRVAVMWDVKHIKWVKDCPIPEGEDFRRINILY